MADTPDERYKVFVCTYDGNVQCVYLNNLRICGVEPYVGYGFAEFRTSVEDLRRAIPALEKTAAERDRLAQEVERLRELIRSTADRLFMPVDDQPRELLRDKLLVALREEQS